ncbi:cytochrome-c peroxidase [Candidatus Thiothrix anitrata]|uniref:Cytochrome-c peroxidase n=1 Tax=Candidatus Thiothrix anitrata TaxID=2823902 RepID=A0ABX7X642_9GAMM|nr:cytochrome-c peroxidase [Candidatus Thiothrix anitrata]
MRLLFFCLLCLASTAIAANPPLNTKAALGEKLFSDVNLSKNRTQSCATCHNPEHGFVDNRSTAVGKAVSLAMTANPWGSQCTDGNLRQIQPGFSPKQSG